MVHGGLRYLGQGQIRTTWHSVREREKLLRDYAGMVESMGFLVPYYQNDRFTPYLLGAGLTVYDLMAFRYDHSQLDTVSFGMQVPALDRQELTGGVRFRDARTDDARLVLRVIQEGVSLGGIALNYVKVEEVCKDKTGRVQGVTLRDEVSKKNIELRGQLVINATGVWADELRSQMDRSPRMRRLRGSHLIFQSWRFPLSQAVSFFHPADNRSVYVLPWEGITLVGTTDVDHDQSLAEEPHISKSEGQYLLEGVRKNFPSLNLTAKDIISTFSGVRPVINTGKTNPSKESRDHVIWNDNGLVTVTGGKMTTFSLLARETLNKVRKHIHTPQTAKGNSHQMSKRADRLIIDNQDGVLYQRIVGRYGYNNVTDMLQQANEREREVIPGTDIMWAELSWAARHEGVVHLEDLLLRRVRLGLLVPNGGAEMVQRIREIVQPELGWDDTKWEHEQTNYLELWRSAYSPSLVTSHS
ncbi:glycerol-3-phosphate dehydrogenase/oxidase [Desulfosporosinus burensis]